MDNSKFPLGSFYYPIDNSKFPLGSSYYPMDNSNFPLGKRPKCPSTIPYLLICHWLENWLKSNDL